MYNYIPNTTLRTFRESEPTGAATDAAAAADSQGNELYRGGNRAERQRRRSSVNNNNTGLAANFRQSIHYNLDGTISCCDITYSTLVSVMSMIKW